MAGNPPSGEARLHWSVAEPAKGLKSDVIVTMKDTRREDADDVLLALDDDFELGFLAGGAVVIRGVLTKRTKFILGYGGCSAGEELVMVVLSFG